MKGLAAKSLLFVVSMGALLGLLELAARMAGYEPIHDIYTKPSQFWQNDWLLGWSHEPGANGTFVGPRPYPIEFRAEVRINSSGLRGPELRPLPAGGYRILILGDSFVAGFEVPFEQTYAVQLERLLNERFDFPVQVINAGVRGYGTDQSYLYYRERGWKLEADLVILVHSNNDWSNNMTLHRARRPFGKPAFALREGGRIDLVGSPVPEYAACDELQLNDDFEPVLRDSALDRGWCRFRMAAADRSALFSLVVMRLMRIPAVADFVIKERIRNPFSVGVAHADSKTGVGPAETLTGELFSHLAREVRRRGARFQLIISPLQIQRLAPALLRSQRIHANVVKLRGHIPDLVWKNDSHLSPLGHRNYAVGLEPIVVKHLLATRPDG